MKRTGIFLLCVLVAAVVAVTVLISALGHNPSSSIIQGGKTTPAAPASLTGQAISHSQIIVQWVDNSNNEDGFRIYRDGGLIASVEPDTTMFQDNDLEYATDYSYLVTAYNEYGETQSLNTATIRTLNPPIALTLERIGVISDHDPFVKGSGDIYVYIAITDGKGEPQLIRIPSSETVSLNDNESGEACQQLFVRDSVGDELRIVAVAFEADDVVVEQLVNLLTGALASYLGGGISEAVSLLVALLQSQPSGDEETYQEMAESPADDFVGAIELGWMAEEDWGIGSHVDVRNGDLRLWFTISTSAEIPCTPEPTPTPFSATFNGWYTSGASVQTSIKGQAVTARLTLSGGTSGDYTIRILRAITLAPDQSVAELTFSYDGTYTSKELSFVPNYATGESSTEGYHIGIVKDGSYIWSMANTYPPRLTVSGLGPLAISFNGWYVGSNMVTSTAKGETVTARLTLSGGTRGTYMIVILRAITAWPDQNVVQSTFSYDGISASRELSFIPAYATGESSTQGYHIGIYKEGACIWSMANAYPPRLTVTTAATS